LSTGRADLNQKMSALFRPPHLAPLGHPRAHEFVDGHRGFETTLAEAPAFYSERSHALALAMHIQGLYSQIEHLFIQLTEKRGLGLRKMGYWRPLLLEVAVVDVPNGPRALLREHTYTGLASMLRMHQAIRADASAIKPGRLPRISASCAGNSRRGHLGPLAIL
jgi:hypothetical protein